MIYRFSQCEVNTQLVELKRDGQVIAIEPQVFRLLILLLEKQQQVLSKNDILSTIWKDRVVSDSALSSCIKAARQVIGDNGEQQTLIKTIRGHGFRFIGEVTTDDDKTTLPTAKISTQTAQSMAASNLPLINNNAILTKQHDTPLSGRAAELTKLISIIEQSLTSAEQVVLLSGSAGIGKSRLLEEISHVADQKGMRILWGSCREESGAPAYWPWRLLLVGHFRNQSWLSAQDAPELANLLPELFPEQPKPALPAQQGADQYRFKLFNSVALLLSHAVQAHPLFLIFDDLHRADQASLSLLEFITNELSLKSVCIIGTYRDTDLTDGHRFYHTLSELSRLPQFTAMQLGHLNPAAVQEWVSGALPNTPQTAIKNIMSRTDGHPLYLSEIIRHLQQGGDPETLPISLKAIINQRFIHLPKESVEVLRAAALVGRRFDVTTLSEVLAFAPQKVLEKLDHAVVTGQLTPMAQPGQYQFSHILIQETLYDSLLNSDRLHLHCNLAEYLENQQAETGSIAFHYRQAAPLGMSNKATYYAQLAAEEADKLLAFEISARYYKQALSTASADKKLGLLLTLGQSQVKAGENLHAINTFEQAMALAEQLQQVEAYAKAAIGMEEAVWRPGLSALKVMTLLQRALTQLDEKDFTFNLRVICALLRAQMMCGVLDKDIVLLEQAKTYRQKIDEPVLTVRVFLAELYSTVLMTPSRQLCESRMNLASKAADITKKLDDPSLHIEVLSWQMQDLFAFGNIKQVEQLLKQQLHYGVATKQPFYRYYNIMWNTLFSAAKGDFQDAQKYAATALDLCQWLPGQDGEGVYGLQMFTIKREQGALLGIEGLVQKFVQDTPQYSHWLPGLALIYTDLGQLDKAKPIFDDLMYNELASIAKDAMWLTCIAYLSEICHQLQDIESAKILYKALLPYKGFNVLVGSNICTLGSTDRYLGLLAMTIQDTELAQQLLDNAIELNEKHGFHVYTAHSRYELALLLSQTKQPNDRSRAQTLVDEVLAFSQANQMQALTKKTLTLRSRVRSGPELSAIDEFGLSKRERQILTLIAQGKQNKDIAEQLFISTNTVAAHIRNILEKTGTSNRIEASNFAQQRHLIE